MHRYARIVGPAVILLVALIASTVALSYGGGTAPQLLADPGPVVRWGLPIAKLVVNLAAAGTIGGIVLACFALSAREPAFNVALDFAAASAAAFTVASAASGFFAFLQVTNVPLSFDDRFSATLGQFFTQVEIGQAWLGTTLIAACVTVLCFAVRNLTALVLVAALAVSALVPMAQQGHSAGAEGHDASISALGLHLAFAAVWLGGLLTIIVLRTELAGGRIMTVIDRYSSLALVSFVVVATSGYVSAEIRIGSFDRLLTPYGILVLVKVAALVILGCFGVLQRRYFIERMRRDNRGPGRWFWSLVVTELGFMGVAAGVAAALARTATPVAQLAASEVPQSTPAQILTGEALPPELTFARYFTVWDVDVAWALFCAFGIFFYLAGVRRLRRRGDKWPVYRSILWVTGMLV
ncbi:MAG: copper transporter, partial [Cryobacterium sp.]|nr:copper transporter [Cryobacterium sp.]